MYRHIAQIVQLGSNNDQCYIQNCVIMNRVIKRFRCTYISFMNYRECIYLVSTCGTLRAIVPKMVCQEMSRDARKAVFGVSDQVRHKPSCTVTEEG